MVDWRLYNLDPHAFTPGSTVNTGGLVAAQPMPSSSFIVAMSIHELVLTPLLRYAHISISHSPFRVFLDLILDLASIMELLLTEILLIMAVVLLQPVMCISKCLPM